MRNSFLNIDIYVYINIDRFIKIFIQIFTCMSREST